MLFERKNKKPASRSNEYEVAGGKGFTLVENLVGIAILGITTLSMYSAFSFGFRLIRVTQENVRADQILVEKFETLRIYDWSKVTNSTFIPTNFTADFIPSGTIHGATYTGTVSIVRPSLTESYSNTLRQVTVSLTWNSAGMNRSRSLTTFVAQNGIQTYTP